MYGPVTFFSKLSVLWVKPAFILSLIYTSLDAVFVITTLILTVPVAAIDPVWPSVVLEEYWTVNVLGLVIVEEQVESEHTS